MTYELTAALVRSKVSSRDASMILLTAADAFGVNPADVRASYSKIRRDRINFREEKAKEIQQMFIQSNQKAVFVLHFDGKMLENTTNTLPEQARVDRLAIVLSYGNNRKLLGIPKLQSGTAKKQFEAIPSINHYAHD